MNRFAAPAALDGQADKSFFRKLLAQRAVRKIDFLKTGIEEKPCC
jgi:hypothetical protein